MSTARWNSDNLPDLAGRTVAVTGANSGIGRIAARDLAGAGARVVLRFLAQSDEMGALPTLYAATQDVPGGSYVGPGGFHEARGNPTLVGRSDAANDDATAKGLWKLSEQLTGIDFRLADRIAVA